MGTAADSHGTAAETFLAFPIGTGLAVVHGFGIALVPVVDDMSPLT